MIARHVMCSCYQVCHGPDICRDRAAVGLYAVAIINTTFINTPPVITSPDNVTFPEDIDFSVTLTAVDYEDDYFIFTLDDDNTHGTVYISPNGRLSYVAEKEYSGIDVIHYTVTEVRTDGETALLDTGELSVIVTPVNDIPVLQLFDFGWNIIPQSTIVLIDAPFNSPDTANYTLLQFLIAAYDVDNEGENRDLYIDVQLAKFGTTVTYQHVTPKRVLSQNCTWPWIERRGPWDNLIDRIMTTGDEGEVLNIPNPCGTRLMEMSSRLQWTATMLRYKPAVNFTGVDVIKVGALLSTHLKALRLIICILYETQNKLGRTCLFVINWMYKKHPRSTLHHVMLSAAAMYKPTKLYFQCPAVNTQCYMIYYYISL